MILPEFARLHGANKREGIYSQHDEQHVILNYFGDRVGRFLDCGAADGVSMSNTYALALNGWAGLAVEPDPTALDALRQTHEGNPSIAIIAAAIAGYDGTIQFHTSNGGGVSTTSDSHRNKWRSAAKFMAIEVPCITPRSLLKMYPGPFHFISVDCEGSSVDVLELFDLSAMSCELLCCEHDGLDRRVMEHAQKHGLVKLLYRSRENLIFGK